MSTETQAKTPVWYWILGASVLLWNLFGTLVFAIMVLIVSGTMDVPSEQAIANMSESERAQVN